LNLGKKIARQAKNQTDFGKAIRRLKGNSPSFRTTHEGLWGTHNLEGFGRHL